MSRIIKMVDEIKEYYNLNDTLLASDLGIMQQTIKGWREGRKPNLDNYNKVKKMHEEMIQEALDESLTQRFEALEEKVEKKPYEVEVPKGIEDYYFIDESGALDYVFIYAKQNQKEVYQRGLAFTTREKAEQYDKERMLLFKLHKWAEEHNGGWKPDWKDDEIKYYITDEYDRFKIDYTVCYRMFIKLPYFKSEELAEQFIKEFGEEIKEVLC